MPKSRIINDTFPVGLECNQTVTTVSLSLIMVGYPPCYHDQAVTLLILTSSPMKWWDLVFMCPRTMRLLCVLPSSFELWVICLSVTSQRMFDGNRKLLHLCDDDCYQRSLASIHQWWLLFGQESRLKESRRTVNWFVSCFPLLRVTSGILTEHIFIFMKNWWKFIVEVTLFFWTSLVKRDILL